MRLPTEELAGLGTQRAIGKSAPRQGSQRHSQLFVPFLPGVFRKEPGGRILKYSSELFGRHILAGHGHIRGRAINHQVSQKCVQTSVVSNK